MSQSCQIKINSDFSVPAWDWCGLRAGNNYIYSRAAVFVDDDEVAIDITADDFTLAILDSTGAIIDTLAIGSGLTITAPNKLNISVGPPVTDDSTAKTGTLDWDKGSTGNFTPLVDFSFKFE